MRLRKTANFHTFISQTTKNLVRGLPHNRGRRIMGQAPKKQAPVGSFSWSGVMWTIVMAVGAAGLYTLQEYRVLSEEMFIFLIIIAVPIAAFCLSGVGQDRSDTPPLKKKRYQ